MNETFANEIKNTSRKGKTSKKKQNRQVSLEFTVPISKRKDMGSTSCTNCNTKATPLWRRDPQGKPLCNACSLFLKLHGVVRPLSLKTDVIKKRQRGSSKNLVAGPSSVDGDDLNPTPIRKITHTDATVSLSKTCAYASHLKSYPTKNSKTSKRKNTKVENEEKLDHADFKYELTENIHTDSNLDPINGIYYLDHSLHFPSQNFKQPAKTETNKSDWDCLDDLISSIISFAFHYLYH